MPNIPQQMFGDLDLGPGDEIRSLIGAGGVVD